MTTATKTTLDAILKEFYLGPVQEQLNNEVLVLNMFEKMSVDWNGKQAIVPIHTARNTSVSFKTETEDLPDAEIQGYKRLVIEAKYLYGRFEITGVAVASAKNGGKGSFIGWMEAEMDKLVNDIKSTSNQNLVTGGDIIGFISTTGAATVHAFQGDFSKISAADTLAVLDAKLPGFQSDGTTQKNTTFLDNTAGTGVVETVSSIQEAAGTITFAANVTPPAGAAGYGNVVRRASTLAASGVETAGILSNLWGGGVKASPGHVEHFGVVRGGAGREASLDCVVRTVDPDNSAGYADLTSERIQVVLDEINELSGEPCDCILVHPTTRSNYVAMLTSTMYATSRGGATQGDGGFLDLSFGNIPMKVSRHVPKGVMLMLSTKTWKLLELQSGGFADLDGAVLSRKADKDAWEGFYRWYYNVACVRPNANGALTGIDVYPAA
mgnify:CR=1 FL=1